MGSLYAKNAIERFSRLGTFKGGKFSMLISFNSDEQFNYVEEGFMESLDVLCQDESQLLCILRKQKTTTF